MHQTLAHIIPSEGQHVENTNDLALLIKLQDCSFLANIIPMPTGVSDHMKWDMEYKANVR